MSEDFYVSSDKKLLDHTWVTNSILGAYWGGWRTHEIIAESLRNSICFGVYKRATQTFTHDRQVGFGRIVTDGATFSWVADILIDPNYQKRGLGKMLMAAIVEHPSVARTVSLLRTRDAAGLYQQFGYEPTDAMRRIPKKDQ